jgi:alpha-tubulin suppressor-like RCC1 family protein
VIALAAGAGDRPTVCSVGAGGAVECWGWNAGALGNGTTANQSSTPVPITGFTGTVTAVSVGGTANNSFACAVTSTGSVQCWGRDDVGELGSTTMDNSAVPVPVTGLSNGETAVTVGYDSACALTSGGAVQCWGNNDTGQLGNNSTTNSPVPVPVMGLTSGVTALSSAGNTTCAVTAGGAVQCWGNNASGELGNNSTTQNLTPVQVMTLTSGATVVSVGWGFACAIQNGGVWCWGGPSHVPVHVGGFSQ